MLTIWGRSNSINVQKVVWCAEELGIPYRRVDAGGSFGGTETSEYLALNPNRLVPAIDDGGFVLWESNVIVRYLSQLHGYGTLFPPTLEQRFDAERWMDWQATTLWQALRPVFIGHVRTPADKRDPAALAKAEAVCHDAMGLLDAQLADRPFVNGDTFSMADIPTGVSAYRWYALDIHHRHLPHLKRWYDDLSERPPFLATVMMPLS
jgi:glutathione S-transferase